MVPHVDILPMKFCDDSRLQPLQRMSSRFEEKDFCLSSYVKRSEDRPKPSEKSESRKMSVRTGIPPNEPLFVA